MARSNAWWSVMPTCSYCGQEFATPTQRMLHEERMHLDMDDGSEKDSMFNNGHPMDIAWQLLKVDKPIMPDMPSDDDDDDDDFSIADMLREALSAAGFEEGEVPDMSHWDMDEEEFRAMKEAEQQRRNEMNEGTRDRPFAMVSTKELEGNLNWLVKPEHAEERQQVIDELNLRGDMQTDPENDIRGWQFDSDEVEQGFGSLNAEERMKWQDEMKGEPFEIAWQMLKAPIMPESVKMTEDTPERQVWSGDFFDPQTEKIYPTRLRWDKQDGLADVAMFHNNADMKNYDRLGYYDRTDSQAPYHEDDAQPLSRFSMERSRHGMGEHVKAPFYAPKSRADMALRTTGHHYSGRKGLATGLMEMIPYWLMANPDIAFNPVTDGFTPQGLRFTTKNMAKLAQNNPALYQKLMVERQPSESMRYWMKELGSPNLTDIPREAMMGVVAGNPTISPSDLEETMSNIRQQLGSDGTSRIREGEGVEPCAWGSDGQHHWRTRYDNYRDKLFHDCEKCGERYYEDEQFDRHMNPERYAPPIEETIHGDRAQELMRRLLNGEVLNTAEIEMLQNAQHLREEEERRQLNIE